MSTYQSEVYECARNTAPIKIDNSEWINEFSGGIKLNKGDNVRILGSFVHEGSSGEEIEVVADTEVNISYSPYVIAATLGTADPASNLVDIGQYSDVAQATDAFGIEPPYRIDPTLEPISNVANYEFPIGDAPAYANPLSTGTTTKKFGIDRTLFTTQNDKARKYGTNIKTDSYDANKITNNNIGLNDYKNFSLRSVPNEFYISQIVKKFILPMVQGHRNENGVNSAGVPLFYDYEPLLDDVVDGEAGMFSGVPKVGMCFTTVDIGAGSGFYDDDGEAYYEGFWGATGDTTLEDPNNLGGSTRYNGLPNLKTGAQSMIGTIFAVRPIKHFINGKVIGCFEIYVSDWVNPAQLVKNGMISITQPANHMFKLVGEGTDAAGNPNYGATNTAGVFHKKVHGSGELPNGYNNNPSWNNINGGYTNLREEGYYLGQNSSTPSVSGYEEAGYEANIVGSANTTPTKYSKGYGMPQGLSFPWNGSHCGGMRLETPGGIPTNRETRYRANSVSYWFSINDVIYSSNYIRDTTYTTAVAPATGFTTAPQRPATPVCLGGYLICNKDTMLKVARGEYNILTDPDGNFYSATPGAYPRIWYDYSLQINTSDYTTRHYTGNRWVNEAGATTLSAIAYNDYRSGYAMCGQPPNINWRQSNASGGYTPGFQPEPDIRYNFESANGFPMGMGASETTLASTTGDAMPRYYSSEEGYKTWFPNGIPSTSQGEPFVWGGYNTCINSIHFQQKETGDVNLGVGSVIADGRTFTDTLAFNNVGGVAPYEIDVINITKASLLNRATGDAFIPINDDKLQISWDNGVNSATMIDAVNIYDVTDNGDHYAISIFETFNTAPPYPTTIPLWRIQVFIPLFTRITIFRPLTTGVFPALVNVNTGASYLDVGVGVNAKAWSSDLLMIREQITKVKVPSGFYTETQLADHINDQLHLNPNKYKKLYGTKNTDGTYSLPTNVGLKEQSLCSEPSVVNGNFVMTYIPDVSYGFTPVVADNANEVDLDPSTKLMNDELYTYDSLRDEDDELIFYYYNEIEHLRPYNGTTVRTLNDSPSIFGKHFKIYSIPQTTTAGTFKPQIHLMRLKGGAYNGADFVAPPSGIAVWNQLLNRWAGTYEMLRDAKGNVAPAATPTSLGVYNYRTRLTRNLCSYGGGTKLWCGANNITLSWIDEANRYSLNNLYTPIRPHERDDPNNQNQDFAIGDAMPSAIINAKNTGAKLGLLTGVYINDLNAGTFTQEEWGDPTIGDSYKYDIVSNETSLEAGQTFLDMLGFSPTQVSDNSNNFAEKTNPFIYAGELDQSGTAIRVGAKIDTAVNGSNPYASNCLNIAPVVQFFVEVETDDFFAASVPLKGVDPYYFIGSDFPTKKFYGNQTGDKLPVIGICARNFHAFNFVFDLGGSSISYTMEEDLTIQSIRTKIYTSKLGNPSQLSPYSSVIYLITRNNAPSTQSIQMPLAEVAAQIIEQNATQNDNMIGQFYSQPLADIRFGQPNLQQPPEFYVGAGSPPPPDTETDTDDDW